MGHRARVEIEGLGISAKILGPLAADVCQLREGGDLFQSDFHAEAHGGRVFRRGEGVAHGLDEGQVGGGGLELDGLALERGGRKGSLELIVPFAPGADEAAVSVPNAPFS